MIGDGLEITIKYTNGSTVLSNRKCVTLQDLKQYQNTDKMLALISKYLWAEIEWSLECQRLL